MAGLFRDEFADAAQNLDFGPSGDPSAARNDDPSLIPEEIPEAGEYAWLFAARSGFDPCTPISYVVGSERLPENGLTLIRQVLGEVTDISGLTFSYSGLTSDFPDSSYRQIAADVWIGWMAPADGDVFAGDRGTGVAGRGGHSSSGSNALQGFAALKSSGDLAPPSAYEIGTLRHEIGHMLGLGHVTSDAEVMRPGGPTRDWGPGDRRGLWLLGPGSGCDQPERGHTAPFFRTSAPSPQPATPGRSS